MRVVLSITMAALTLNPHEGGRRIFELTWRMTDLALYAVKLVANQRRVGLCMRPFKPFFIGKRVAGTTPLRAYRLLSQRMT